MYDIKKAKDRAIKANKKMTTETRNHETYTNKTVHTLSKSGKDMSDWKLICTGNIDPFNLKPEYTRSEGSIVWNDKTQVFTRYDTVNGFNLEGRQVNASSMTLADEQEIKRFLAKMYLMIRYRPSSWHLSEKDSNRIEFNKIIKPIDFYQDYLDAKHAIMEYNSCVKLLMGRPKTHTTKTTIPLGTIFYAEKVNDWGYGHSVKSSVGKIRTFDLFFTDENKITTFLDANLFDSEAIFTKLTNVIVVHDDKETAKVCVNRVIKEILSNRILLQPIKEIE